MRQFARCTDGVWPVQIEHFYRFAMDHDFLEADFIKVQRAANQIARSLVNAAFGMMKINRSADLLRHRKNRAVL